MPMSRTTAFKLSIMLEAKDVATQVLNRVKAKLGDTGEAFEKFVTISSRLGRTTEKMQELQKEFKGLEPGSKQFNKLAKSVQNVSEAQIELAADADRLIHKFKKQAESLAPEEYKEFAEFMGRAQDKMAELKSSASQARNQLADLSQQNSKSVKTQADLEKQTENTTRALDKQTEATRDLRGASKGQTSREAAAPPKVEPPEPRFKIDNLIEARTKRLKAFEKSAEKLKRKLNTLVKTIKEISIESTQIRSEIEKSLRRATKKIGNIPLIAKFDVEVDFPGFTSRSMRTSIKKKFDPASGNRRASIRDIPLDVGFVIQKDRIGLKGLSKRAVLSEIKKRLPTKEEMENSIKAGAGIHVVDMLIKPRFNLPPVAEMKARLNKDLGPIIDILTGGKLEEQTMLIPIRALSVPGREMAIELRKSIDKVVGKIFKQAADFHEKAGVSITKLLKIKFKIKEGIKATRDKILDEIEARIPGKKVNNKHILKNDLVKEINVKADVKKLDKLQIQALKATADYAKQLAKLEKTSLTTRREVRKAGERIFEVGEKSDFTRQRIDNLHGQFAKLRRTVGVIRNQLLLLTFATAGLIREIQLAIRASTEMESALIGLSSVARNTGNSLIQAKDQARNLAKDGLLTVTEASQGLRNLLSAGMGLEKSIDLMNALTDAASFNRQGTLALGAAVVGATQGIKNQNSIMVDNAGITRNLSLMYRDFAASVNKSERSLTDAEKNLAIFGGIMKEAAIFTGDANKIIGTTQGSLSKFNVTVFETQAALGDQLKPILSLILIDVVAIMKSMQEWIKENEKFIKQDLAGSLKTILDIVVAIAVPLLKITEFVVKLTVAWGSWIVAGLKILVILTVIRKVQAAFIAITAAVEIFKLAFREEGFRKASKSMDIIRTAVSKTATDEDRARAQKFMDVMMNEKVDRSLLRKRQNTLKLADSLDTLKDKSGRLGSASIELGNKLNQVSNKMANTSASATKMARVSLIARKNILAIGAAALITTNYLIKMVAAFQLRELERQIKSFDVSLERLNETEKDLAERFDLVNAEALKGTEINKKLAESARALAVELATVQQTRVDTKIGQVNAELTKMTTEINRLGKKSITQFFEIGTRLLSPDALAELRNAQAIVANMQKRGIEKIGADTLVKEVKSFEHAISLVEKEIRQRDILGLSDKEVENLKEQVNGWRAWTGRLSEFSLKARELSKLESQLERLRFSGVENQVAMNGFVEEMERANELEVFKITASFVDLEKQVRVFPKALENMKGEFVGVRDEAVAMLEKIRKDPLFTKGLQLQLIPVTVDPKVIAKAIADSISAVKNQVNFATSLGSVLFPDSLIPDIQNKSTEMAKVIKVGLSKGGVGAFLKREGLGSIEEITKEIDRVLAFQRTKQIADATQQGIKMRKLAASGLNFILNARLTGEREGTEEIEKIRTELFLGTKAQALQLQNIHRQGQLDRIKGLVDLKENSINIEIEILADKRRLGRLTQERINEEIRIGNLKRQMDEFDSENEFQATKITIVREFLEKQRVAALEMHNRITMKNVEIDKMYINARLKNVEDFANAAVDRELFLAEARQAVLESSTTAELNRVREALKTRREEEVSNMRATEADKLAIQLDFINNRFQTEKDQTAKRLDLSISNIKSIMEAEKHGLEVSNKIRASVYEQFKLDFGEFSASVKDDVLNNYDLIVENNTTMAELLIDQLRRIDSVSADVATGMFQAFKKSGQDIEKVIGKVFKKEIAIMNLVKIVGVRSASEVAASVIEGLAKQAKAKAAFYAAEALAHAAMFDFAGAAKFGAAAAAMGGVAALAQGLAGKIRSQAEETIGNLSKTPGEEELGEESGKRRFGSSIQAQELNITIAPHTTISGENIFLSDGSVTELESNVSSMAVQAIIAAVENNEIDLAPVIRGAV